MAAQGPSQGGAPPTDDTHECPDCNRNAQRRRPLSVWECAVGGLRDVHLRGCVNESLHLFYVRSIEVLNRMFTTSSNIAHGGFHLLLCKLYVSKHEQLTHVRTPAPASHWLDASRLDRSIVIFESNLRKQGGQFQAQDLTSEAGERHNQIVVWQQRANTYTCMRLRSSRRY